jgi:hypothetical protein
MMMLMRMMMIKMMMMMMMMMIIIIIIIFTYMCCHHLSLVKFYDIRLTKVPHVAYVRTAVELHRIVDVPLVCN